VLWGLLGCLLAVSIWAVIYWRWHPAFLRGLNSPLALIVAVTIPITVLSGYLMAMITGAERFRLRAGLSFFEQAVALLAVVAFVLLLGQKPESALLGNLFGLLVGAVLSVIYLKNTFHGVRKIPWPDKTVVAGLRMGLRGQFGNMAAFFNYRLDVFIVNYFLDSTQVGFYALGVVISEALWQIPQAAAVALFPRTARTLNDGAAEFTCLVMRQVLLIACVSGIALALVAPVVIPLFFGARFTPSVSVIWWILPGTVALSLGKVASVDLTARGKNGYTSAFAIIAFLVTASCDWFLIPRAGIQGAALASSIAYFLNSVLLLMALKHELRVGWPKLLVPSGVEFAAYQQAWFRIRNWLRPAEVSAGARID
jgi:O-antigen/teichoic acid export membrane protein